MHGLAVLAPVCMNDRSVATLLFGVGMLAQSLMYFLDFRWSSSGPLVRSAFVVAVTAAIVGLAVNFKHRRGDKRSRREHGGGAV